MPQIVEHDVWHDKTPPKPLLPLSPYSKSTCNILFSNVKRCSKVKHSSWFICFQCFLFHKYVQYSMGITFDCWICFQNWRSQELPASYLLSQVCLYKSTRSDGRMAIDFVSFNLWSDTTYLQWYHLSREIRCHSWSVCPVHMLSISTSGHFNIVKRCFQNLILSASFQMRI